MQDFFISSLNVQTYHHQSFSSLEELQQSWGSGRTPRVTNFPYIFQLILTTFLSLQPSLLVVGESLVGSAESMLNRRKRRMISPFVFFSSYSSRQGLAGCQKRRALPVAPVRFTPNEASEWFPLVKPSFQTLFKDSQHVGTCFQIFLTLTLCIF